MFKVSGIRVPPFEVESAPISHEAVVEAAVVPHADAREPIKPCAFLDANEWHPEDWYRVRVPVPEQWRKFPLFGLEVRGPSMNRRYPEGTILICVGILDAAIEPQPEAVRRSSIRTWISSRR